MRFRIKSFLHMQLLLTDMLVALFNHTWAKAIVLTDAVSSVKATDITSNKTSNTLGLLQEKVAGIEKQMNYYNIFQFLNFYIYCFLYIYFSLILN